MWLTWLHNENISPILITCVGSHTYFSNQNVSRSKIQPAEMLDQIEADLHGKPYSLINKKLSKKREKMRKNIKKNVPHIKQEDEWLNHKGNQVDEKLFIDMVLGLTEDGKHLNKAALQNSQQSLLDFFFKKHCK
ncbi:hypothetical protein KEM48_009086 [Puccinia striiformis f. sp. tritici PST-130]|nr:hypothetical protein KEM48_009086 [Puccinia striiformis f. sp. tritici PST-130]